MKREEDQDAIERIDEAVESVLTAAGTSFRHYTLPASRDAIREAMRKVMVKSYTKGVHDGIDVENDRVRRAIL